MPRPTPFPGHLPDQLPFDKLPGQAIDNLPFLMPVLIFEANDGVTGEELWMLDADGNVSLVADINMGPDGSFPNQAFPFAFTEFNGALYFSADDGASGFELYRFDAFGNVELVEDINPGPANSNPYGFTEFNGELYFSATSAAGQDRLWKVDADGNAVEVANDIEVEGIFPFAEFNGELYFSAAFAGAAGTTGQELFKVDADGNVVLVADINPGPANSRPDDFTELDGELYFAANDGVTGQELWKIDADGNVVLVADINPGPGGSSIDFNFNAEFNGELYFLADDGTTGRELWKVDADGNVSLLADINPGPSNSNPSFFVEFNGALYFQADDGTTGDELWKINADGTVELVADINPGPADSDPLPGARVFNGELYFQAESQDWDGNDVGTELFKVNADGNVELVADINPGPADSDPFEIDGGSVNVVYNGEIYFQAESQNWDGNDVGRELFKINSDGDVELVADINPGPDSSEPEVGIESAVDVIV